MIYLFVLGRILLGGFFIMSGMNHFRHLKMLAGYAQSKGTPMAREAVLVSGLMMFLGGLGILLGIYVQISILLVSVALIGITFQMHQFWKESDQARMADEVNFKKNMAILGAALMLLMIPLPWAVSLMM
jgi:uncharacterized membrane protein YphA (DoxX/SURF4 family)